MNLHGVNEVSRQKYTGEPLAPEPSIILFELAIEKPKIRKLPGIDQNPAVLFKAAGRRIR